MFGFFKKEETEELNTEECEELYHIDKVDVSDSRYIITTNLKKFLQQFVIWSCNRPVDQSHIDKLTSLIKKEGLKGIFTVATFNNNRYYIIDGQHRYYSLQNLYNENFEFYDKIIVDINIVKDEEEIVELFKTVNKSKPLTPRETPCVVLLKTVNEMERLHPRGIKDNNRTIYPYITKKQLSDILLPVVNENPRDYKTYIEFLERLNNYFSNRENIRNAKLNNGKFLEKANSSGFYLGIDTRFSWIEDLKILLQQNHPSG
jgi:hypothetical protein